MRPDKLKPAPAHLSRRGKALWHKVADEFELRPDEEVTLLAACRTLDEVERCEAALRASDVLVAGVAGRLTANPMLHEVREHRKTLASQLGGIGLAEADAQPLTRSQAGRALDRKRWSHGA